MHEVPCWQWGFVLGVVLHSWWKDGSNLGWYPLPWTPECPFLLLGNCRWRSNKGQVFCSGISLDVVISDCPGTVRTTRNGLAGTPLFILKADVRTRPVRTSKLDSNSWCETPQRIPVMKQSQQNAPQRYGKLPAKCRYRSPSQQHALQSDTGETLSSLAHFAKSCQISI